MRQFASNNMEKNVMSERNRIADTSGYKPEAVFRIRGKRVFWGPGIQELLVRVERCHSVKRAAAEMYMSYAKARRLISLAEEELGCQVVESRKGGVAGGGSVLTEEGRR